MSDSSSPARFNTVRLAGTPLDLRLMSCPGVRQQAGKAVSSIALLEEDLGRLRRHDVQLMLSCLCEDELPLGLPAYRSRLARDGIRWLLLPIRDMSVPDATAEPAIADAIEAARQVCGAGGRVAIHCKAGLGRTGMIAARLVTTYGLSAAKAIAHIRREHSAKAVETPQQEAYVAGFDLAAISVPQ